MKKLLLILFFAIASFAGNLENAKSAYNAGDYERAIDLWKQELDEGLKNSEILFNLGNAYYRTGKIGFAIFYYESAKVLAPNDADIDYNLKLAKSQTRDKTEESSEENPILSTLFSLHHAISLKIQLILIGILIWLFSILAFFRFLFHSNTAKNACIGGMFVSAIVFCIIGMSAGYKIFVLETETIGVVTAPSAEILSGPGQKNQTLNVLSEGTEFQVHGIQDGFAEISLGERIKGFASLTEIGIVK